MLSALRILFQILDKKFDSFEKDFRKNPDELRVLRFMRGNVDKRSASRDDF